MRLVRPVVAALVAAVTLTACSSSDITSPGRRVPGAAALDKSCRNGYLTSSGRCGGEEEALTSAGDATITTADDPVLSDEGCRNGYLTSSGRCKPQ